MRDPYAALHLLPTAPPEVVDAAHRALVRLHHPDTAGSSSTALMATINAARDAILAGAASPPPAVDRVPPSAFVLMPFGKYKDERLGSIPTDYLVWILQNAVDDRPGLRVDIAQVLVWRRR